jgi:hypothetical protein
MKPPGTRTATPTTLRSNSTAKRWAVIWIPLPDEEAQGVVERQRADSSRAAPRLNYLAGALARDAKARFEASRPRVPARIIGERTEGSPSCGAAARMQLVTEGDRMTLHDS